MIGGEGGREEDVFIDGANFFFRADREVVLWPVSC